MVRGAGGRRGVAGCHRGRGRGGDHLGMGQFGDEPPIPADAPACEINPIWYDRSQERFTWNGVLRSHSDNVKRINILPNARDRDKNVPGSCVYYSIATALEAAYRIAGVEIEELAWEDLYDMVDERNTRRTTAALRVLKYHGIHKRTDYKKASSYKAAARAAEKWNLGLLDSAEKKRKQLPQKNLKGKRFKVSQFYEFCNVDIINDDVLSGLDQHNMKAAINNMLSRTVMLAHFPISANYYCLDDGEEHIYAYDEDDPVLEDENEQGLVVTGFGFEETIPYFEFLDCNGEKFGKKGFSRILPSSIISLYAFDVIID